MSGSDNLRGAGLMVLSMAAFTLNDTFIKLVSDAVPLFQAVFLRGLLTTALIAAIAAARGELGIPIARRDWRVIGIRTVGEIGSTVFFLTALFHMQIGSVTAILQSLPLAITLVGAALFKEPVGWRRYLAILVGFIGVLMIVQPGGNGFNGYSLLALGAVGFVVLRDLSSRRLRRGVPSIFVALTAAIAITAVGALGTAVEGWQPVSAGSLALLAGASLFLVAAYLFAVMVMRVGDIAFVSTFRYTALIWALVLGLLVFGEVPNGLTLIGSVIVVGTGIYTLYREGRLSRRAGGKTGGKGQISTGQAE